MGEDFRKSAAAVEQENDMLEEKMAEIIEEKMIL